MDSSEYKYQEATVSELSARWDKNIADNIGDNRWVEWKSTAIENHQANKTKTFVVLCDGEPIGEGTLIFELQSVELNGLRIDKQHEGKGYISKLVKIMEQWAKDEGYKTATIGVEAKNTHNIGIYLHWGYDAFIKSEISEIEEEGLILIYSKEL